MGKKWKKKGEKRGKGAGAAQAELNLTFTLPAHPAGPARRLLPRRERAKIAKNPIFTSGVVK